MYSVQLEKSTTFSCAEWSVEDTVSPLRPAAGMPHAVSPAVATAPSPAARSSDRRASAPRPPVMVRTMAARCGGDRGW